MRLIDGCDAIGGDLPGAATVTVTVPSGAGSSLGTGVQRLSAVHQVRDALTIALEAADDLPIVIGGDCGVELASIAHAASTADVAVVWLDAHPDLNTPESSPSGAFHGMVLRTLLGDGAPELVPPTALKADRVILAGTRALDDAESDFAESAGITTLAPGDLTPEALTAALRATGATSVYLHVDLDVLDPAEFDCVTYPEPFGITTQALLELIAAARATLPLAGAAITEFAPASPDSASESMSTILRVVGALTKAAPPIA